MALVSGGVLVKTPGDRTVWTGSPSTWDIQLSNRWVSYAALYKQNSTVGAVVNKLAKATARLPLKVYERSGDGRRPADTHPYSELLRRPSSMMSRYDFWQWTVTLLNIYGETFWGKVRDRGGRPVELLPLHPVGMHREIRSNGDVTWRYDLGGVRVDNIRRSDFVHFKLEIDPDDVHRGLSPLEGLRSAVTNTDAARRAQSAFWRNGGRPSVVLTHPGTFASQATVDRLRLQWNDIHAGADNFGKVAILEEGMKPEVLSLSAQDAQYVEGIKLDREEILVRYDVPPPVLHVLDHATFSNITEQMRSMYRDTMAPRLKDLEETLEFDLREPDFGGDVYAEFLLDEVLRGDFEQRVDSYQKGINSGWLLINEVREMENRPPIDGGERPLVNSTMVPLEAAERDPEPSDDELAALPPAVVRMLMGRLSRQKSLEEIDDDGLVDGLNGHSDYVLDELQRARADGVSVAEFRGRLRG
jgi:HK97 family phage portal protein